MPVRKPSTELIIEVLEAYGTGEQVVDHDEAEQTIPSIVEQLRSGELRLIYARDYLRGTAALNASKTHCSRGHPFDEKNTRWLKGGLKRKCKTCENEKARKRWLEKRR